MLNNPYTVFNKYVQLKYLTFVPIDIYVDNCTHTWQCKTMITWFKSIHSVLCISVIIYVYILHNLFKIYILYIVHHIYAYMY